MNTYPGVDLALEVASNVLDVVLDGVLHLGLVLNVVNPLRKLGVPDESVTSDLEAVLGGKVDDLVAAAKVELALLRLGGIPLHRVLGGDLTEVGLDDGVVLLALEKVGVGDGAIVELALVLDQLVDAFLGLARLDGSRHGRDQRGGKEEGRELHSDCCLCKGKRMVVSN